MERIYIVDLKVGDIFCFPGFLSPNICERVFSEGGWTSVTYRPVGENERYSISRTGLTTVDRIVE